MQLKIRYAVQARVTQADGSLFPHTQAKSVFDPSTVGIFTQEIGKDASELLFMEKHRFSPLWETRVETTMWLIICLADKYGVSAATVKNNDNN